MSSKCESDCKYFHFVSKSCQKLNKVIRWKVADCGMFQQFVAPEPVSKSVISKPRFDMTDPVKKTVPKPYVAPIDSDVFSTGTNDWRDGLRNDRY